jgi:hypothetical protein
MLNDSKIEDKIGLVQQIFSSTANNSIFLKHSVLLEEGV